MDTPTSSQACHRQLVCQSFLHSLYIEGFASSLGFSGPGHYGEPASSLGHAKPEPFEARWSLKETNWDEQQCRQASITFMSQQQTHCSSLSRDQIWTKVRPDYTGEFARASGIGTLAIECFPVTYSMSRFSFCSMTGKFSCVLSLKTQRKPPAEYVRQFLRIADTCACCSPDDITLGITSWCGLSALCLFLEFSTILACLDPCPRKV